MKELELGQIVNGNPFGAFHTPEYADALIEALLVEIGRVYWNVNQEQWDRLDDPKIPGVEFRSYYWGEDEKEAEKLNLCLPELRQAVYWYKHPGRGQTCSMDWMPDRWCNWYTEALEIIRKADTV